LGKRQPLRVDHEVRDAQDYRRRQYRGRQQPASLPWGWGGSHLDQVLQRRGRTSTPGYLIFTFAHDSLSWERIDF